MVAAFDRDALRVLTSDVSHLDGLSTAAIIVDDAQTIAYCNPAGHRLLGLPRDHVEGLPFTALFDEGLHGAVGEVLGQALTGAQWAGEDLPMSAALAPSRLAMSVTPLSRDGAVVAALALFEDHHRDGADHRRVHRLSERLTRLARVTAELSAAHDLDEVTEIVVTHAADAAGATVGSLVRLIDAETIALVGLRGGREGAAKRWATFPLSAPTPVGDAIRSGRPVLLTGRDEIAGRYPDLETSAPGERSMMALPLRVSGQAIGAIGLSFPGKRRFDSAELEFLGLLADTCAQAIDRIRAHTEATEQATRLAFLSEASARLADSLDYHHTLRKVAQLAVPSLADWCAIRLLEDGDLRMLEVAHANPSLSEIVEKLSRDYTPPRDAPYGVWNVIRSGRAELTEDVTDEMLQMAAVDEEQLRLLRQLSVRSAMIVPLRARGKVLGAISWATDEGRRRFTKDDLALAEELAQRAAVAIDNAQLHSETRQTAVRLQQAVLPESLDQAPGWEFAGFYSPSGRTDVGGDFYDVIVLEDRVGLFVGDVMGRGVTAAAAMAQIRAAVRSYVAVDPSPESVMARLDTMFATFGLAQLVTLVYVLADPASDSLQVVNAGHPPPVLLHADGRTSLVEGPLNTPLGVSDEPRSPFTTSMRSGDTLLMFTDGLIERRREAIDVGQARLADACHVLGSGDLDTHLRQLVEQVRDHTRSDDVAALAARRS